MSGTATAEATSTAPYHPPTKAPAAVPVDQDDEERAVDFVLAWFDGLNYGLATGDADPLRATTGLGCWTCANWVTQVQSQKDGAVRRTGGYIRIEGMAYVGQSATGHVFRASLLQGPGTLAIDGATPSPLPSVAAEIVDLTVGISTSKLKGTKAWTMKSIVPPTGS